MKLSIIIIGDEILLGRVQDTNSGLIARTFGACGHDIVRVFTVGDSYDAIRNAVESALAVSDAVITTGGLGPTRDDITKQAMMDIFGGKLVLNKDVLGDVEALFAARSLKMNDLTAMQAMVPDSCTVIRNSVGTAPIMCFEKEGKMLVAMPGVPYETRFMLPQVLEKLNAIYGQGLNSHRELTVSGIGESHLAGMLAGFEDKYAQEIKLAYLPVPGAIHLRVDSHSAEVDIDAVFEELKGLVADFYCGNGSLGVAEVLLAKLAAHGYTVASAESCTGGNIAHLITAIPGCSDYYRGSVVSYHNEVKENVLGVSAQDLMAHGAVSEPVVQQMAYGACRVCGTDCAVATSGIAGPGGGSPEKPVGTVWIAACTPQGLWTQLLHCHGDRQAVIERASALALKLLVEHL